MFSIEQDNLLTSAMRAELLEHGDQIEKLDRLLQQYEQRIFRWKRSLERVVRQSL